MNVSSQGRPTSLFLSWAAPAPGSFSHALCLARLSPPEGQQLQAHTNTSSFEFQHLVLGSHYLLEVTALRPCGQKATVILTAHTGVWPAHCGLGRGELCVGIAWGPSRRCLPWRVGKGQGSQGG